MENRLGASIVVALGILGGGYFVGSGIQESRKGDHFVTVRGLSERIVAADLVIWPIVYSGAHNDLQELQEAMDAQASKVADFLAEHGFESSEWSVSPTRVTTQQGFADNRPEHRFLGEATIVVRSDRVEAVQEAIQTSGSLVRRGVTMVRSYEFRTEFLFTALADIKPEMIADATRDARRAAEQFAEDSGSSVGAIRRAEQGYFSIDDRDPFSPEFKKIRVVTTVEFLLRSR